MKTIGDRIKLLRGQETREGFGARFGKHRNTVMCYENGKNHPDSLFLTSLCQEYKVTPNWLLFGEGPMRSDGDQNADPTKPANTAPAREEREVLTPGTGELARLKAENSALHAQLENARLQTQLAEERAAKAALEARMMRMEDALKGAAIERQQLLERLADIEQRQRETEAELRRELAEVEKELRRELEEAEEELKKTGTGH